MARNVIESDDYIKPFFLNWLQTYPGGIKMASLLTLRGFSQYLPSDKYTNSSFLKVVGSFREEYPCLSNFETRIDRSSEIRHNIQEAK